MFATQKLCEFGDHSKALVSSSGTWGQQHCLFDKVTAKIKGEMHEQEASRILPVT